MQYGFYKGHSTQAAMLHLAEHVHRACNARMVTLLVLFDFSRAFDTVDHSILLSRLRSLRFSVSALAWFASYLYGRVQRVVDKGSGHCSA